MPRFRKKPVVIGTKTAITPKTTFGVCSKIRAKCLRNRARVRWYGFFADLIVAG